MNRQKRGKIDIWRWQYWFGWYHILQIFAAVFMKSHQPIRHCWWFCKMSDDLLKIITHCLIIWETFPQYLNWLVWRYFSKCLMICSKLFSDDPKFFHEHCCSLLQCCVKYLLQHWCTSWNILVCTRAWKILTQGLCGWGDSFMYWIVLYYWLVFKCSIKTHSYFYLSELLLSILAISFSSNHISPNHNKSFYTLAKWSFTQIIQIWKCNVSTPKLFEPM